MITVVMPLFNKADTVEQAIDSVLAQEGGGWELIVVDDGSTDDSVAKVMPYVGPKVQLIHQSNAGVAVARNRGLQQARGSHVAWLDADDWWQPDHLAQLQALQQKFPDAVLYGTGFYLLEPGGGVRPSQHRPAYESQPDGMVRIRQLGLDLRDVGVPFFTSSIMCERAALLGIGGFPAGVTAGEDWLTWLWMSCLGETALAVRPTVFYREPPSVGAEHRRVPQHPDVVAIGAQRLLETYPSERPSLRAFLSQWHRMRAMLFMELNHRGESLSELRRSWSLDHLRGRDIMSVFLLLLPVDAREVLLRHYRVRKRARSHL